MNKKRHTFESKIAGWFKMSEDVWMKHANPWSVYTRFTALPFIVLAIWSRTWVGVWSWAFIILSLLWIWFNPRLFGRIRYTDNWASRGVFGERVWLNRKNVPIPEHHRLMPTILNSAQVCGLPFIIWGLWILNFWIMFVGLIIMMGAKIWYVDRMVCIYEDMKHIPEYGKWECKKT